MAVTLKQSNSARIESATTAPAVTLASAPVSGNLLVILITSQAPATTQTATGYTQAVTKTDVNGTKTRTTLLYKVAGAGESATITATSGNASSIMAVFEFQSGTSWALDKTASTAVNNATAWASGTTATTASANQVLVSMMGGRNQATISTPTNSFTLQENQSASAANNAFNSAAALYRIVSATGTYSTGVTASTGIDYEGCIATFSFTSGTNNTISVGGTITPVGTLKRSTLKKVAGGITPVGTLRKAVAKKLSGGITPTGLLKKLVKKRLAGGITPTGVLRVSRVKFLSLTGSITPVGTLRKSVTKRVTGSITPIGSLVKRISKRFSGAITPTGTLFASRVLSIVDFRVVITQAQAIGSTITQVLLRPIVTRVQSLGTAIFSRSSHSVEITQEDPPSTDITI